MSASSIQKAQMILVGGCPNDPYDVITTVGYNSPLFTASTNAGEIGVFNKQGTRLTEATAATTDEFVIAVSRGDTLPPLVSDVISKDRIREIKLTGWVTDAEQVDYIGYNGSSQSLDITYAGELFMVQINLIEFLTGTNNMYIKHGAYKSALGDGQAEIALGLTKSINFNFGREAKNSSGDPKIKAYSVCSDAGTANAIPVGADYTHFSFVRGSKYVTGTNSSGVAMLGSDETNANIVAGVYVRIGTAVTSPVYKVISVTAGTGTTPAGTAFIFELDAPFNDASQLIAVASTEYITNALGAAADWGVKMVGQPYNFDATKDKFRKVRWTTALNANFDSTVVTKSVAPTEGQGNYEQIASLENFLMGYRGEMYRNEQPWLYSNSYSASSSVAGGGYDVISIKFDSGVTNFKEAVSEKQLLLAIPVSGNALGAGSTVAPDYALAAADDDLTDVLEVLAFGAVNTALSLG